MATTVTLDDGQTNLVTSALLLLRAEIANDIGKPGAEMVGHTPELIDMIDRIRTMLQENAH